MLAFYRAARDSKKSGWNFSFQLGQWLNNLNQPSPTLFDPLSYAKRDNDFKRLKIKGLWLSEQAISASSNWISTSPS